MSKKVTASLSTKYDENENEGLYIFKFGIGKPLFFKTQFFGNIPLAAEYRGWAMSKYKLALNYNGHKKIWASRYKLDLEKDQIKVEISRCSKTIFIRITAGRKEPLPILYGLVAQIAQYLPASIVRFLIPFNTPIQEFYEDEYLENDDDYISFPSDANSFVNRSVSTAKTRIYANVNPDTNKDYPYHIIMEVSATSLGATWWNTMWCDTSSWGKEYDWEVKLLTEPQKEECLLENKKEILENGDIYCAWGGPEAATGRGCVYEQNTNLLVGLHGKVINIISGINLVAPHMCENELYVLRYDFSTNGEIWRYKVIESTDFDISGTPINGKLLQVGYYTPPYRPIPTMHLPDVYPEDVYTFLVSYEEDPSGINKYPLPQGSAPLNESKGIEFEINASGTELSFITFYSFTRYDKKYPLSAGGLGPILLSKLYTIDLLTMTEVRPYNAGHCGHGSFWKADMPYIFEHYPDYKISSYEHSNHKVDWRNTNFSLVGIGISAPPGLCNIDEDYLLDPKIVVGDYNIGYEIVTRDTWSLGITKEYTVDDIAGYLKVEYDGDVRLLCGMKYTNKLNQTVIINNTEGTIGPSSEYEEPPFCNFLGKSSFQSIRKRETKLTDLNMQEELIVTGKDEGLSAINEMQINGSYRLDNIYNSDEDEEDKDEETWEWSSSCTINDMVPLSLKNNLAITYKTTGSNHDKVVENFVYLYVDPAITGAYPIIDPVKMYLETPNSTKEIK